MKLAPHQERVIQEQADLHEKIDKLRAFCDTDIFRNLDKEEKSRLRIQEKFMSCYSDILVARIGAWK